MRILDLRGVGRLTLLRRTFEKFSEHDMPTYAAALAFRAVFALFPFLLFLIAMLGTLNLTEFFDWLRDQAELIMPPMTLELVNPIIDQLQEQNSNLLSFGILVALWVSSIGIRTLMNAMNMAYDVKESRPGWKLFPLSILYTLALAMVMLVAAALMVVGPQVMEWLARQIGLGDLVVTLWTWLRWPVVVILLMLVVALMYYFMPDVEQEFRFITPGSVVAVVVWIAASLGFGIYVQNFGNYDAVYGSIGAMIVLMLYFYLSAAVLLFGVVLNAVIEHASAAGKDEGERSAGGDHDGHGTPS